jgi:SAM-dependent methyltransferase
VIFQSAIRERLASDMAILDVGSGRRPALSKDELNGLRYVGLDVSATELTAAPEGTYGETFVTDVASRVAELVDEFELIVSWQVLEHVKDIAAALENMRAYLRPGGQLVAMLSGTFSVHGILNKLIPGSLGVRLMRDLLGRDPSSVFPAYYDRCHYRALVRLLEPWGWATVMPFYQAGAYFDFSHLLRRAYFTYEDWAWRTGRANLATHYLIVARR